MRTPASFAARAGGHALGAHLTAVHSAAQLAASGCIGTDARVSSLCAAPRSIHIPVDYLSFLPVLIVGGGGLLLLALSAVLSKRSRPGLYPALTMLVGAASAAVTGWQWLDINAHGGKLTVGDQVTYDHFSVLFLLLISVAVILGGLFSDSYLRREGLDGVEAYVLMLMSAAGAMLMAEAAGLIMVFLGLEIMSIALYVMTAYHRRREESGEAGLKYFILGSFSSAILLYGIALVYGATGSTQFNEIASFLATNTIVHPGVLIAGTMLVIVGLGFKVAAVPFHFWTPDVYQGAPTPFTGYMAAVAKAAGFAGLLRTLDQGLLSQASSWRPAIWLIAVLTLLVGSVLAIAQRDLKRMLAYSSISQAGYVLVGVQAASARGESAALFYLLTYTFIIAGSFAVVAVVQGRDEARDDLGVVRGLGRRQPVLAAVLLVFLLAQAGVPFTSGFLAKFYVIESAVASGSYALAVIAMLAAAVAAFFYLRLALLVYSTDDGIPQAPVEPPGAAGALESPATPEDRTTLAGLAPLRGVDDGPRGALATLDAPPDTAESVSLGVRIGLAVCVAFTIFAGVSSPVLDFARQATTLFR